MKPIINPALLDQFRQKEKCEWCGCTPRHRLEPHHSICRGHGGGTRFDLPEVLIALCGVWDQRCHDRAQRYEIPHLHILQVIAAREGMTLEDLQELHYRLKGKSDRTAP